MNISDPFVDIEEYNAIYSGRRYGLHASIVKDIADPQRLGRVRVICPSVYGESLSPWCTACFPTAVGVDSGMFEVPPLDSYVWVTFEEGDVRSPVYMGGFAIPTNSGRNTDGTLVEEIDEHQDNPSPLSMHAQGYPDGTDMDGVMRDQENVPGAQMFPEYGKVSVRRTPLGSCVELNDTTDASRVFILHGPSGAYYEMRHDGQIVEVSPSRTVRHDRGHNDVHDGASFNTYRRKLTESFGGEYSASYLSRYSAKFGTASVNATTSGNVSFSGSALSLDVSGLVTNITGSQEHLVGENYVGSVGGNAVEMIMGSKSVTALNAQDVTTLGSALTLEGANGYAMFRSTDRAGITASGLYASSRDVVLGDMSALTAATRVSPVSVPLVKEGVVMSTQLHLALSTLIGHFVTYATTLSTGGATPGFGGPNPVLAAANIALNAALASWAATYAPLGAKVQPVYASDTVFVTK